MSFNKENVFANINIEIKKPQSMAKKIICNNPSQPSIMMKKERKEITENANNNVVNNYTYRPG
jgi:hypothetical protein